MFTQSIPACPLGKQLSHLLALGHFLLLLKINDFFRCWLAYTLANWASKLALTLLAQQENLLVPNYRTDLFSRPVHSSIFPRACRVGLWPPPGGRPLGAVHWGPPPGGRPLGHSVELFSYKIKMAASQSRWLTSKATRKIGDCVSV